MSILPSPWIGSWSYSSFFILLFSNLNNKSIGLMFPVFIGLPCIVAYILPCGPFKCYLIWKIMRKYPTKKDSFVSHSGEYWDNLLVNLFIQTENNTSIIVPVHVYFKEFNLNERAKNWLLAPWCCTYLNRVNTASVYQNRSSIMH